VFSRRIQDSPRNERGGGQVSHLLLGTGDFGSRNLSVTWVECASGSQQQLHAHSTAEQVYVIIEGRGRMLVGGEEQDVEAGTMVFIPPGQPHAIRNDEAQTLIYVSATSPPFPIDARDDASWVPTEQSVSS